METANEPVCVVVLKAVSLTPKSAQGFNPGLMIIKPSPSLVL